MSGSSNSGGGVTPPYPSPSLQVIEQADHHRASVSSRSDGGSFGADPSRAGGGATNYYASGNSRISLSNAVSSLQSAVPRGSDYMYAMDTHDNMHKLSNSNSLSSMAFEDSQRRSYHPIEFLMGGSGGMAASTGNLAESLQSGRLARNTSESSPTSGLGMVSFGHLSTGQNSFFAAAEQAQSPLLPRPITYGLGAPDNPNNDTKLHIPPSGAGDSFGPAPPFVLPASNVTATGGKPAATTLSDSLPSIHGSVFSDAPKQLLPQIRSKDSLASTITTADKSPLEPSMTARGPTSNRSLAPSLNISRFPMPQSPNSSVATHRPTTPTPLSDVPHGADGGRAASAFPTQRLPNPPERPPSHLIHDSGLADSRCSANETARLQSSARSSPTAAVPASLPSPVKSPAYQTPLALLAASDSNGSNGNDEVRAASPVPAAADVAADVAARLPAPPHVSSVRVSSTISPSPPSHHAHGDGDKEPTPLNVSVKVAPPVPVVPPTKEKGGSSSASSSASRQTNDHQHQQTSSQPSESPASHPSAPPVPATALPHFAPIIQQTDFRKSDVKDIACTGAFTMEDIMSAAVKLRLLRHELLSRAEPLPTIQKSAISAGRVKRLKTTLEGASQAESAARVSSPQPPPRVVDVNDFQDTLVVFDNVVLAISFALWGSVAHYNELVRGLLNYCAADVVSKKKSLQQLKDGMPAEGDKEAKGTSVEPAASSVIAKARLNVPFSSVLRFLNHNGVDVLVVTSNRKAASSFCAKRRQVRRRVRRESADAHAARGDGEASRSGDDNNDAVSGPSDLSQKAAPALSSGVAASSEQLRRVLVALSYDDKQCLWCPLTVSRPIRPIAEAWHQSRRLSRRQAHQTQRRERRRAQAAAAEREKKAAAQAKLNAWQQRMTAFCPVGAAATTTTPSVTVTATEVAGPGGYVMEAARHVAVVVPNTDNFTAAMTDESSSRTAKAGNKLPFDGVLYPNLTQTDVGFKVMLTQGMHPLFGLARLRLLVGMLLGVITFLFGLAFIIFVTKTTGVCFFDSATLQCILPGDVVAASSDSSSSSNSSSGSTSCFPILAGNALDGFDSKLSNRFLYGRPVSPGNCLIVTMCCVFTAILACVLIAFFAARYLALGGVRPCFHYILQAVQFVLSAIACAFAAYVVFCFHERRHTMACATLKPADATLCAARLGHCGARYAYTAHTRLTGTNVALALAIVYLILCVLHWLTSLLPVVPSPAQQDAIPTATPDTYAFRPSLFAPDGLTPPEVERLRAVMQGPLRQDLQQWVQQQDRLLTASTTIGEIMQANRIRSLKQMKLNEQRRLRRTRPFAGQRKGRDRSGGTGDSECGDGCPPKGRRGRSRYLVWSDGEAHGSNDSGGNDSDSTMSSTSAAAAAARDRNVVLAPRLVQRVNEIGSKVRARASQQQQHREQEQRSSNPLLLSASIPTTAEHASATVSDSAAPQNGSLHPSPSSLAPAGEVTRVSSRPGSATSVRRTPSNVRKVVVMADDEEGNCLTRPSSESRANGAAVPSAPLTAKPSFARGSSTEAQPLSGGDGPSSTVSPSVVFEIDHIVSRLQKARQSMS